MELALRDKTIVILGSVQATLQNAVVNFLQQGADVAIIDSGADKLQKFCQNLNDQKEMNEKFGRATAIPVKWEDAASIKDAIGKAAQTFGSIDIMIDALCSTKPTPLQIGAGSVEPTQFDEIIQTNLVASLHATQFIGQFLKSRKRGRMIYLVQDPILRAQSADAVAAAARSGMIAFAKTLARELQEQHVSVNCVSLGLTEEYLLGHFLDCANGKEALEKMKAIEPSAKMSDPEKISHALIFLCGSSGAAITGQHLVV